MPQKWIKDQVLLKWTQFNKIFGTGTKLDAVGPIDNKPSTAEREYSCLFAIRNIITNKQVSQCRKQSILMG